MDEPDRLAQFTQYLERRAPGRRTTALYVSDVRQFAAVICKPWREITLHDIDTFVDQQRQIGLSAATVKRRVAALKVFFDFLAEETGDLSWANPVRFKRHAGKQPRRLPRDLKDDAVAKVWAVIDSARDRAWFALLWRAGLRVGELVGLRLDDLLAAPTDTQPARLRVLGKGQKERLVLLTADAYAVLTAWLGERPANDTAHIFLNDRGQRLTVNGIEWLLHQYGQQAGVPLTPHQLRHTFARQVTEAGMPLTSLSKLLGHAQITTTQIYTAGADPQLAQAYQQAMAHVAPVATPPDPVALQPPSAPVDATIAPLTPPALPEWAAWGTHLPPAVRQASLDFVRSRLALWKPQRQRHRALQVLGELRRFWDWLAARHPGFGLAAVQLRDLQTYRSERIAKGCTARTPDVTLSYVVALLRAQADQGQAVDASVFRLHPLPRSASLPRHLSEYERQCLKQTIQQRLATAAATQRLENACYFVLAHAGLRAGECVELEFQDCDLPGRRLLIRQGKGLRDRVVYLSDTACAAIQHYLAGWARLPTAPLFTQPDGRPISYEWLGACIGKLGEAAGVAGVTPHRLRHTLATHLLNVGMDITQIQKLLGHQHLDTTMIYARVLDTTLEAQYRRAMAEIERQQPPLSATPVAVDWPVASQDALSQPAATQDNQLDNSV
jgi:site-specific recombinase XerD